MFFGASNMNSTETVISAALDLLGSRHGIPCGPEVASRIGLHLQLVREWNKVMSLVSPRDSQHLETHTVDSLSLVPFVHGLGERMSGILDIGSGNGFPIIPMKIVMTDVPVWLVERSLRKVGFLRKVVAALGLTDVTIIRGSFPEDCPVEAPAVITARAVDKPKALLEHILSAMPPGGLFLCQSGDPQPLLPSGFEAARVQDWWDEKNLRRGTLHTVRRCLEDG